MSKGHKDREIAVKEVRRGIDIKILEEPDAGVRKWKFEASLSDTVLCPYARTFLYMLYPDIRVFLLAIDGYSAESKRRCFSSPLESPCWL